MSRPFFLVALLVALACGESREPAETAPDVSSAGASPPEVWLLTGGTVLTMDAADSVIEDGAVAVRGELIEAVGSSEELIRRYPEARRLSVAKRIVMPGLINLHTHVPMTLFRGLADDLPLMEWLEEVIFPAEAEFVDEEFVRWGTRLACLEMLQGGTTTFVDMYYFEDVVAEEADRCGMRAVVGETLIDFPAPDNRSWEEAIAYMERFVERWLGDPRITPAVAPHAPYTVSAEHLQQAYALAGRYDVPMLIHLAEDRSEVEQIVERTGLRPIDYLESIEVLGPRVVANHVVWPDDDEIRTLVDSGVGIAHCPESNMKVAAGVAPVPKMLAVGLAVGLGTDGAASNNDLDMWSEMDTAAKLHKVANLDPTLVPAREAVRMATIGGARALNMEAALGSLEEGKLADLIVIDPSGYHHWPLFDPYSALVYSTRASDVETVVVHGRMVVEDGEVLTIDAEAVREHVEGYRARLQSGFGK